jgi:hypothetical protein
MIHHQATPAQCCGLATGDGFRRPVSQTCFPGTCGSGSAPFNPKILKIP